VEGHVNKVSGAERDASSGRLVVRRLRWVDVCVCVVSWVSGLLVGCAFPLSAGAYATVEGAPLYSGSAGLPDGRVYEQVSPADTNGNEAGFGTSPYNVGVLAHYDLSSPSGNAVLFEGTGPMGESPWGASQWFVATRNATGWHTRALTPRAQQSVGELGGSTSSKPLTIDPSADLSHAMVEPASGETLAPSAGDEIYNVILQSLK